MKNSKLLREKKDIIAWLNQYEVKDYELLEDSVHGYVVNVNGNVCLQSEKLKYIAVKFSIVKGEFNCSNNQLKTLEGCPKEVGGNFYCYNNELRTLEGCPKEVEGSFYCDNNKLTTLKGSPNKVGGDFYCSHNQLTSLKYGPIIVGGSYYSNDNKLTTLELKNLPKIIQGIISLNNNLLLCYLQEISDINEIKKILMIQEEQELLHSMRECNKMNSNILKL